MKKLLILPLLVLLTGCVSYYYPETAFEDGVYYAEDDPSYVVYDGTGTSSVYYPWYSLDYFYLGYYPSPTYRFAYTYPIGFNYGFSPWYYPSHYYGYYSPWYGSSHHHHYYPAWRPYRGYNSRHHNDRYRKDHRSGRYAKNHRRDKGRHDNDRRNRSVAKNDRDDYSRDRDRSSSVRRYVSTTPGGRNGNRGMVVRNRDSAKVSKSRLHVDRSSTGKDVKSKRTQSRVVTRPTYSTERAGTGVRYRSNAKQGRSRTGPVGPAANTGRVVVKAAPVDGGRRSNANDARQASRASVSRQAPVRVVSGQAAGQKNRSRANHSSSNKSPRVVRPPAERSDTKKKSSRSGKHNNR